VKAFLYVSYIRCPACGNLMHNLGPTPEEEPKAIHQTVKCITPGCPDIGRVKSYLRPTIEIEDVAPTQANEAAEA